MDFISLLITATALSMDAFAASVCKGLSVSRINLLHAITAGVYFGFFQAIMPVIGFITANIVSDSFHALGHVVAFVLLCAIGFHMLTEAEKDEETEADAFSVPAMISMAFATSIDALAAGVSFSMTGNVDIRTAALSIGLVTFLLSASGVCIGHYFGAKSRRGAQIAGGLILILIGAKILVSRLYG